jgi:hypothetical protein
VKDIYDIYDLIFHMHSDEYAFWRVLNDSTKDFRSTHGETTQPADPKWMMKYGTANDI